ARRDAALAELRQPGGVAAWNARSAIERSMLGACAGVDLSGADLRGARFDGLDLRQATLANADLEAANLSDADLRGADLTSANLAGVQAHKTRYDATTKFPTGFVPYEGWKCVGAAPPAPRAAVPAKERLDFDAFFARVPPVADSGRLKNEVAMLKAEKYQLFSQADEGQVVGVLRSQSSAQRVYACRLTSAGRFECGTQNLRLCGGLHGKVCKHLLVLILGLTRAGTLDPGTA